MDDQLRAPEPAATVVPIRDGDKGVEALMLRRNAKGTFAGMWVFPGGRIDAADGPPGEVATAKATAVREAQEEAGLVLDPEQLVPYSHWTPPEGPGRRFPTWFFLAAVRDAVDVVVDGGEIHDHAWAEPEGTIARRDAGEVQLAPPTWVTLRALGRFATVDDVLHAARSREPVHFATHIHRVGDVLVATWAGDASYDTGDLDTPGGRCRLVMDPAGWRFEER